MTLTAEATTVTARKKSNVRQRQAVVAVRLLPEEHASVLAVAHDRGISVAEVLRRALLRDLRTS